MPDPQPRKFHETTKILRSRSLLRENITEAKRVLGQTPTIRMAGRLEMLTREFGFSMRNGDLQIINSNWYVTHTGLVALARRKKCRGIHVEAARLHISVIRKCNSGP